MHVSIAHTQDDLFQLIRLREMVFVVEQGVPIEIELDDEDRRALHLIVRSGREVVGTARLVSKGRTGKIGRMAVKKGRRRKGIGTALIEFIKKISFEMDLAELVLHAQEPALAFYERLGFAAVGKRFQEAGIPHWKMIASCRPAPVKKPRAASTRRKSEAPRRRC